MQTTLICLEVLIAELKQEVAGQKGYILFLKWELLYEQRSFKEHRSFSDQ